MKSRAKQESWEFVKADPSFPWLGTGACRSLELRVTKSFQFTENGDTGGSHKEDETQSKLLLQGAYTCIHVCSVEQTPLGDIQ